MKLICKGLTESEWADLARLRRRKVRFALGGLRPPFAPLPCSSSPQRNPRFRRGPHKAGHALRPGKIRLTKSGPLIPCIELLDIKNAAPGVVTTEDGKAEKNPPSL